MLSVMKSDFAGVFSWKYTNIFVWVRIFFKLSQYSSVNIDTQKYLIDYKECFHQNRKILVK